VKTLRRRLTRLAAHHCASSWGQTDPDADPGSILYESGDTDVNTELDVDETWTYTAAHTLTVPDAVVRNRSGPTTSYSIIVRRPPAQVPNDHRRVQKRGWSSMSTATFAPPASSRAVPRS